MSAEPISGTAVASAGLAGASVFGLATGIDYGVVFGAFAGAVFYIATAADLSAARRLAYFVVSYIAGSLVQVQQGPPAVTSSSG